jgi:hypothetical protein
MPKIERIRTPGNAARRVERDISPRNLRRIIAVATVSTGLFILLGMVQTTLPPLFLEEDLESHQKNPEPQIDPSRIRACECRPDAFESLAKDIERLSVKTTAETIDLHVRGLVDCMNKESSPIEGCLSSLTNCVKNLWEEAAYTCPDQDLARKSLESLSPGFFQEIIGKSFPCKYELTLREALPIFFRAKSAYPCLVPRAPKPSIDSSRIRVCRCPFDNDPFRLRKHGRFPDQKQGSLPDEIEEGASLLIKCMKEEASKDNCLTPLIHCVGKVWRQLSAVCLDQAAVYAISPLVLSFSFYKQIVPIHFECNPELTREMASGLIAYAQGAFPCLAVEG